MEDSLPFRRIAVIGTGLIGGSFALAVRKNFPAIHVIGWDSDPAALGAAVKRAAIHESATDLTIAVRGANLVYVALPVGAIVKTLPAIASAADSAAVVTDAGSTKAMIGRAAAEYFQSRDALFLGGHPMAGKERSGIENADAELFRGAPYAIIANETATDPRIKSFAALLESFGAQIVRCDADTHDWSVGVVSHLPQLLAIALAGVIQDESDETGFPLALAGQGLHDSLRLAGSPYKIWRDILVTNNGNISHALHRFAQAIEHLQRNLTSHEIEEEFRAANDLYSRLRR